MPTSVGASLSNRPISYSAMPFRIQYLRGEGGGGTPTGAPHIGACRIRWRIFGAMLSIYPMSEKKPRFLRDGVPIKSARSSRLLPSSHDVSGRRAHAWQAARFRALVPCPSVPIQRGSEEQSRALDIAALKVPSSRPGSPCRTSPPSVPSESPLAV